MATPKFFLLNTADPGEASKQSPPTHDVAS